MKTSTYDIAISGAGPVGSALALLLARKSPQPERIVLMGKGLGSAKPAAMDAGPKSDPRTLALNHGSRVLLEQLGAWPSVAADITTVHVSQRGRYGRTLIQHSELDVPRLGSVVGYDSLLSSLHQALSDSGVTLIEAAASQKMASGQTDFQVGDRLLRTAIAVQSDGAKPVGVKREYRQEAVLATVRASRPRQQWAFERFTTQGPLAVLPHPQAGDVYGVVWCCSPETAAKLRSLDDHAFASALQEAFGDRLGKLECISARHVFPLSLHAGPTLINARTVAIGNAAQTLHPVAGQGLNLGLRDAAQLTHALTPWLARSDTDASHLLAQFAAQRRPDRWLTTGITDFLPRVFTTGNPLIEHAGGLALLGLDLLPALRKPLARNLLQGLRT